MQMCTAIPRCTVAICTEYLKSRIMTIKNDCRLRSHLYAILLRCPSVRYSWPSYLYWAIPSGQVTRGLNQKNHLCKVLGWYSPFCFFTDDWVCSKNYSPPTEYAVKLFHAYWVCGKNYSTPTEYAVKIIPCLLSNSMQYNYSTPTEYAVKIIPRLVSVC
jgi:hypothetical protein